MGLKNFAASAGSFFNRAKQLTEEKLGQAEKTELDAHFENLLQRSDKTKFWTEQILEQTKTCLQPNPGTRMEDFVWDKLDKKKRERATNHDILGQYMIDAGNEFGPGTSYGNALIKVGQTQQRMGQAERDFIESAGNSFIQPLKAFLEGDMKTVMKERKILENKRLDLDVAKNKMRRAKTQGNKEQLPNAPPGQAEAELRVAQAEFDRQAEITKLLLDGISSTHAHHLRCLHDFVESQANFYAQTQQYMSDLQRQLGSMGNSSVPASAPAPESGSMSPTIHPPTMTISNSPADVSAAANGTSAGMKAKVLYDYDAADMKELSLCADEVNAHAGVALF